MTCSRIRPRRTAHAWTRLRVCRSPRDQRCTGGETEAKATVRRRCGCPVPNDSLSVWRNDLSESCDQVLRVRLISANSFLNVQGYEFVGLQVSAAPLGILGCASGEYGHYRVSFHLQVRLRRLINLAVCQ